MNLDCFTGGGQLGAQMQAFDWSATPLGSADGWATSLRTAVSICLSSRFPIVLYWGAEYIVLYNDAYSQILAKKHPWALGRPAREVWAEIWDVIAPMLDGVTSSGQATYSDDLLLILERNGYPEECYFSFSFSAIRREDGKVGGIFTAVTETTREVISERRLSLLNDLASHTADAQTVEEACRLALATLGGCPLDIPFAMLYLLDNAGGQLHAQLAGQVRVENDSPAAVTQMLLTSEDVASFAGLPAGQWPLARAVQSGETVQVDDLPAKYGALSGGAWPEATKSALILPITRPGQAIPYGLLVCGASPRRPLDEEYRHFLRLVAGQIATAVANTRAREEERQRSESLAALDRAKTEFFSNISHEFRTPLTLMLGPLQEALAEAARAEAARAEEADNPEAAGANAAGGTAAARPASLQHERLELIYRNSLRLLKLVNNLLDFSRTEAGRMNAAFEPTDLAALTAYLAGTFRSAIEQAGLRLVIDCPPLPEPVFVDRDLWENIVLNLLSNAYKFTLEGEIIVRLRWTGAGAELTISDTGTGIPEDEIPHIFERFHRVRGEKARTSEGSGIGLALVQELVKIHGGQIGVESNPGQGSRFAVFLPAGMEHLPQEQVGRSQDPFPASSRADQYIEEARRWQPAFPQKDPTDGVDPSNTLHPPTIGAASTRARILLVDDNADMRDYLHQLLSQRWQVETAANGEEALSSIQRNLPDLVLADVMLPGLDGFELLRQLRSNPLTQELPIILLSARAGDQARIEGLQAGANDYIVKPFTTRELLACVEARLALHVFRREADRKVAVVMDRLSFLVHAGRILASSLDYQSTLTSLANLIVPKMADWCTVALMSRTGELRREVFVHKDARQTALTHEAEPHFPYDLNALEGVPAVFRTGKPRLYNHVSEADLEGYTQDSAFLADLKRSGITSALMVPLIARGRTLGVISLVSANADFYYTHDDLELLEQLADRAALAVDNANLYRDLQEANQELEIRVQVRTNQLEKLIGKLQQEVSERQRAEYTIERLLAISQRLNATLEMEPLLSAIVLEALTLVNAESGYAGRRTPEGMESHIYYAHGRTVLLDHLWKPGEGLPGRLLQNGQPYLTNTAQSDPQVIPEMRDIFNLTSALATPILNASGEVLGFFEVNNKRDPAGFTPADQEVLAALANIAGIAIQNVLAYEQIREAEARLESIYENSPMGIVLVDPEGRYRAANPTFLKMLGYRFEEIEQKAFISLLHPEDAPRALYLFQNLVSGKTDRYQNEKRFRHKKGRWVWVRMNRSVIRDKAGSPTYIIGMIEDISARKQVEAELANVQRQLLENVEAERLNFSQEVHDGPIQNLVALLYELTLVQSLAPEKDEEEIQERLENLNKGLKQAVGELRDICKELRPPELERYGLAQLITSHAATFQKKHPELELKLDMAWDGRTLPERARLALFRVYQQALANILRHAQASQVVIRLEKEGSKARLEITDNGKGFRVPSRLISLSHGGHLGLIGSAERIKAVGGDFQVESEPGKGTKIRAVLPVARQVKVQN